MNTELQSLWVSTWHEKGALHAEKLSDYLREVNRAWLEGRSPSKWATGVFETLEQALQKNRELKRTFHRELTPISANSRELAVEDKRS